jgi:hypothetical protein
MKKEKIKVSRRRPALLTYTFKLCCMFCLQPQIFGCQEHFFSSRGEKMQQERQPVKVFPTHDPDGNPLPPSPGDLPSAIFSTVAGVIFLVVGIVSALQKRPKDRRTTDQRWQFCG